MSRADRVMRLNVGGMYYTTMKSTLAQIPGTFLWRIATGNQSCLRDDRGNYVIDRDGPMFRYVNYYVRHCKIFYDIFKSNDTIEHSQFNSSPPPFPPKNPQIYTYMYKKFKINFQVLRYIFVLVFYKKNIL